MDLTQLANLGGVAVLVTLIYLVVELVSLSGRRASVEIPRHPTRAY